MAQPGSSGRLSIETEEISKEIFSPKNYVQSWLDKKIGGELNDEYYLKGRIEYLISFLKYTRSFCKEKHFGRKLLSGSERHDLPPYNAQF